VARCVVSTLMAAVAAGMVAMATGHAADVSKQTAVEVGIELGTKDGNRVFSPGSLTFARLDLDLAEFPFTSALHASTFLLHTAAPNGGEEK
jgi:hypothetical protein